MPCCHKTARAWLGLSLALVLALILNACGGGGGGGSSAGPAVSGATIPGNNVLPVVINAGVYANDANSQQYAIANRMYASVTLCTPGSSNCVTVDNLLVDTGSVGVRLFSTAAITSLGLLPPIGFSTLQNCIHFLDNSSAWGNIKLADVKIGNMVAPNIPLQLINDPSVTATSPCSGTTILHAKATSANDAHALSANGILGIGIYTEDCGSACVSSSTNGMYYTCTSSCSGTLVATSSQVQNPVPHFASDNNGVVVVLPTVANAGSASATGSVLFGVGTQSNNQLGSSTLLQTSVANSFNIRTSVTSATPSSGTNISRLGNMSGSFLDTGSNGLYFGTNVMSTACSLSSNSFYCPTSDVTFSATLTGTNNINALTTFVATNSDAQFNSGNLALPTLTGVGNNSSFDWGLPFFFGRTVFFGIEGLPASTGVGSQTVTGPFYAF